MYEKYRDDANPYLESKETVFRKYTRAGTTGYLFIADETAVGAVRIRTDEATGAARISALCVLPAHQNKGIAQKALSEIEKMHPDVETWYLDAVLEEAGTCHLYEKPGYKKTGNTQTVNKNMTPVFFKKESNNP